MSGSFVALALLAAPAQAQGIGPQVISLPVSQANGGTGAASLGAGSVTPTGGSANTLANFLGGVGQVPNWGVTGVTTTASVNIDGNLAGSNPCTSDGNYAWNYENGTGEMDAISCFTANIGAGNDAFVWWQAPVSGALTKIMNVDKVGNLALLGGITTTSVSGLTTALSVGQGGTGAATAGAALTALGAAANGANSDITSLSALSTPLSVAQGGTGSASAGAALTALGAASSGTNSSITSLTGLSTPLSVAQGGTAATTASAARTALSAAASGANGDITSLTAAASIGNNSGNSVTFTTTRGTGFIINNDSSATNVNYLYVASSKAGNAVGMQAAGTDTNIGINVGAKGTGAITLFTPTFSLPSIAAAGSSNAVCWTAGGSITYNSGVTTCLVSSARFKDIKRDIAGNEAMRIVLAAQPKEYTNKINPQGPEVGLVCEQMEKIDKRLVDYDKQGRCSGVRYEQYAGGILTAAVQQLKHDNDDLRQQITSLRNIIEKPQKRGRRT